jgi:hypothetical protein
MVGTLYLILFLALQAFFLSMRRVYPEKSAHRRMFCAFVRYIRENHADLHADCRENFIQKLKLIMRLLERS